MKILFDKRKYKIFLAVIALLIFFNIIAFSNLGQNALFGFSNFFKSLSSQNTESRSKLLEEVVSLEQKVEFQEVNLAEKKILEEENQKLRSYLNFFKEDSFKYVLADVLWKGNFLNLSYNNQNIVINKGSQDGIYEGLAVVNESGIVIGKIIAVENRSSQLCLINNNFCKMSVALLNSSGSIGLSEGNLGLSVKINFVPQGEEINEGDQIISSGLEKDIPRGLLLAKVNHVDYDHSDIWQNITAEALFNPSRLNILAVIIPE